MNTQRKQVLIKTVAWFVAEVVLNLAGLDNLADYSEFVFEQHADSTIGYSTILTTVVFDRFDHAALFA